MSSIAPQAQAKAALLVAAVIIAAQIPTTLQEIDDPLVRGIMQIVAILVLIGLGSIFYRVQVKPDSFKGFSLRPGRYRMSGDDITPDETPKSKAKKREKK